MKAFLDNSVLVRALHDNHPGHARAFELLQRARSGELRMHLAAHTLAEAYAVLTALPLTPRITQDEASRMIKRRVA